MTLNTTQEVTAGNINLIVTLSKRTMDILVNTVPNDILSKPTNINEVDSFNKDMETIITNKLRQKLKI